MTHTNLQVRRATVEDLSKLIPLWNEEQLPSFELQDRYKEFQVVLSPEGELLGAIGLMISDFEGFLHSEVFAHPEQADSLREQLWQRFQILAQNFGLVRIWTQLATPFWHSNGFAPPHADVFSKLPPLFAAVPGKWLVIQLREETTAPISLDKEFAMFQEAEKAETQKLFRQARIMKVIAGILGVLVFILVIAWAILFMKAQSRLHKPRAIDPLQRKLVVVKEGYLYPGLTRIAPRYIMLLTPGAGDMRIEKLTYTRRRKPVFPFEENTSFNPESAPV